MAPFNAYRGSSFLAGVRAPGGGLIQLLCGAPLLGKWEQGFLAQGTSPFSKTISPPSHLLLCLAKPTVLPRGELLVLRAKEGRLQTLYISLCWGGLFVLVMMPPPQFAL